MKEEGALKGENEGGTEREIGGLLGAKSLNAKNFITYGQAEAEEQNFTCVCTRL